MRGKVVRTTIGDAKTPCPLDRVNRQFRTERPNQLWVSDFTYVSTWQGWLYVAFAIDVFARRIVGWRGTGRLNPSAGPKHPPYQRADAFHGNRTTMRQGRCNARNFAPRRSWGFEFASVDPSDLRRASLGLSLQMRGATGAVARLPVPQCHEMEALRPMGERIVEQP